MDFSASIVVCLHFGVLINHSRDQPARSIFWLILCASPGMLKAQLRDASQLPPQPLQQDSPVSEHSPFSAGSGRCHQIEMIWEYKGKGVFPPSTLEVHALQHGQRVAGVGTRDAGRTERCHSAFGVTTIFTLSVPFACLQSSRGLNGGQGLNKYLPLFQVGKESWS